MTVESQLIEEELQIAERLENVALPVAVFTQDLYKSGTTHVGFGESHGSVYLHKRVSQIMPVLKECGVEVICLELDEYLQEYIDLYLTNPNEEILQKVVAAEKEAFDEGLPVEGRIITPDYFDIIRNAAKLEIRVIATDDVHLKNVADRDKLMASNIPLDKKVFVYAGQVHLSGKKAEYGGIQKYLSERGVDIYNIRQYLASEGEEVVSRKAVSKRMIEVVKFSPKLTSFGAFAFDISKDEVTYDVFRKIHPSQNSEYFGDGFTFSFDNQ